MRKSSDKKRDILTDPSDYILDLQTPVGASSADEPQTTSSPDEEPSAASADGKPLYVRVYFECCRTYARLYRGREQSVYAGYCPKCARPASIAVSEVRPGESAFIAR